MRELAVEGCDCDVAQLMPNSSAPLAIPNYDSALSNDRSLAHTIQEMISRENRFYSVEFFPPKHVQFNETFQKRGGTWSDACEPPLFCAVTWRADAPLPAHLPGVPALRLGAALAQRGPVLLHLAGAGLAEEDARRVLRHALTHNITSVLLLQGDTGGRPQRGSFPHAVDLVRFVRREFGQRFSVFVAGHPGGHPEAASYQDDLRHLRDKVDAGADGIISQVVFEAHKFAAFVRDCRHVGIFVPILPGIMLILSCRLLERASQLCRFSVPTEVADALRPIAGDDSAVQEYGVSLAARLVRDMFSLGCAPGVHFFTMNRPQLAATIWQRVCAERAASEHGPGQASSSTFGH
ncbi:methylenetetrahydrofolate reductase (NADPH) isoform X1 [Bacillus rossius redtenbacheri]|uniref:methylenetetrahydrofolate reductase (NADPH) isoform X1 n=1 Tax=Bacillus rossius redtenbacheri TaxID=93214 RepID=UPI002FDED588